MRFVRRKKEEEAELQCSVCHEHLPEDATVCHMCGEQIEPDLEKRSTEAETIGQQQIAGP